MAYTVRRDPRRLLSPTSSVANARTARAALEAAGFTVQEEAILGGFFGTVRQTDPAAGTMLKKGSVVTITIV